MQKLRRRTSFTGRFRAAPTPYTHTHKHTHTHGPDLGFLGTGSQALMKCEGREGQPWCFPKCAYSIHIILPFVVGEGRT